MSSSLSIVSNENLPKTIQGVVQFAIKLYSNYTPPVQFEYSFRYSLTGNYTQTIRRWVFFQYSFRANYTENYTTCIVFGIVFSKLYHKLYNMYSFRYSLHQTIQFGFKNKGLGSKLRGWIENYRFFQKMTLGLKFQNWV